MSLITKLFKTRIGRPIANPPAQGDVQFPTTTIHVRNSVIATTGNSYAPTVLQHLADIQGTASGQALLVAISALGKRQVIKYGGPNVNQAAGGGLACYKLLRMYQDMQDTANFAAELAATITASPHNKRWVADKCYNTTLPLWSGGVNPSPFRGLPGPLAAPVALGAPKPLPPTPLDLAERMIDTWLAGTALPNYDQMDILCLVLEPWLRNGTGASTLISYDPHKVIVANSHRPPQVALYHELVHAYYNAAGGQLGREDSIQETNGGRLFELMAVGLAPFDTRPVSENQFRAGIAVALRPQYP